MHDVTRSALRVRNYGLCWAKQRCRRINAKLQGSLARNPQASVRHDIADILGREFSASKRKKPSDERTASK
jgi:hypothetical protein